MVQASRLEPMQARRLHHNTTAKWSSAPRTGWPPRTHDEWLAEVRGELESVWPEARQAKLLHGRVVTQPAAVFSVTPEVGAIPPAAANAAREPLPGRRLDSDRLARYDGRRRSQRPAGGGIADGVTFGS